jgi:hypothetical protein
MVVPVIVDMPTRCATTLPMRMIVPMGYAVVVVMMGGRRATMRR